MLRLLDAGVASLLLFLLLPVIACVAAAVKLESRGPVFIRCRRAGLHGRTFAMLKFRKMVDGAGGSALTAPHDERFTRIGRFLARAKLDELPQLWNVLRGQMSLVGPRPEDLGFVEAHHTEYDTILSVPPGITGLSQLAFARESEILDPQDRTAHYVSRILPQKVGMDILYASRRSLTLNLQILVWTAVVVFLRRDVAVNRATGHLSIRRRPPVTLAPQSAEQGP